MTDDLAQLCSLASFGRAMLAGSFDAREFTRHQSFIRTSTTFRKLDDVTWQRALRPRGRRVARDPEQWLRANVFAGCTFFELVRRGYDEPMVKAEEQVAAFAGGGYPGWMLQLHFEAHTELWRPIVERVSPTGTVREVGPARWSATYFGARSDTSIVQERTTIIARTAQLRAGLDRIIAFSREQTLAGHWLSWFDDAVARLDALDPEAGMRFPPTVWPRPYSLPTRRLLAAAQAAMVFGGMGSWNDQQYIDPDVQQRFWAISRDFSEIVMKSLVTGVNDM